MRGRTSIPWSTPSQACGSRVLKFLLAIAALSATGAALAQGASEAILGYGNNISGLASTTVGWTLQTTQALTITELGCFADVFVNNPGVANLEVGLWNDSGALLASNTVSSSSPLFNQTRYEAISPVSLVPGQTYHLGVYYPNGSIGIDVAGAVAHGSITTAAAIQLGALAASSAGFAFPAAEAGTTGSIYAGPNFLFLSQPVLAIQPSSTNQVRLSWSTGFTGYTLQSELGLSGTWANAELTVNVVSNEYAAFDTIGPGPKYYRLLK